MEYYDRIIKAKWDVENKQLDFLKGECLLEEVTKLEEIYRNILSQKKGRNHETEML